MRNKVLLSILSAFMLILTTGCASRGSEPLLVDVATEASADTSESEDSQAKELSAEPEAVPEETALLQEKEPVTIAVFICGAVENPGVYELLENSRVDDAVKAAGGFSSDADRNYVNLAAKLTDGVKLLIPTMEEAEDKNLTASIESFDKAVETPEEAGAPSGLVNINTATAEQLKTLPGIGESVAGKIIKYREENGAFKDISDIMKVSGIKEKLFSKIKDSITV